ncbi:MAG: F0F1 ATP synthase subunit A [Chloroflexi bacterium]|nr:F0F1 ATP synthase subunit A [Chloroflexota bacterium]
MLILGIVFFALLAVSLAIGGLGSSFLGREPFAKAPVPEIPAEVIGHIGPMPVSNTMLTSFITVIVLVVVGLMATRKMKLVPNARGLQNLVEWGIEKLIGLVEGVVGHERGRKFFPFIATIFLFVFANAWLGLLPGYGSIVIHQVHEGREVEVPLLRAANTDLNLTLALALASFVFVESLGFAYNGFFGYAKKFVNLGALGRGFGKLFTGKIKAGLTGIFMGIIEAFVGIVELISELVRLVSFSFRLFGNMIAGEILLLIMFFLVPFVVPVIFYGLETMVGLIQAMIFAMLTLVFASMATAKHEH